MISITLPIPPSVNAMYRRNPHGYGLFKTNEAKAWIKESGEIIKRSIKRKAIKSKVDVEIRFYFARENDIDNRIKALLDLLQEYAVVENDKQVYSLLVTKDFDKIKPRVEIEVKPNE